MLKRVKTSIKSSLLITVTAVSCPGNSLIGSAMLSNPVKQLRKRPQLRPFFMSTQQPTCGYGNHQ